MPMFLVNFIAGVFCPPVPVTIQNVHKDLSLRQLCSGLTSAARSSHKAIQKSLYHRSARSLSADRTNYHRRDFFYIYESVEKFRASQMRKIDDIVGNLPDSPSDLFPRSQVQLDSLAGIAVQYAEHSRIRLDAGSFLGEQAGTKNRRNDDSEKK